MKMFNKEKDIWMKWDYQYKNRKHSKEPNRHFGVEEYSNWIEKKKSLDRFNS